MMVPSSKRRKCDSSAEGGGRRVLDDFAVGLTNGDGSVSKRRESPPKLLARVLAHCEKVAERAGVFSFEETVNKVRAEELVRVGVSEELVFNMNCFSLGMEGGPVTTGDPDLKSYVERTVVKLREERLRDDGGAVPLKELMASWCAFCARTFDVGKFHTHLKSCPVKKMALMTHFSYRSGRPPAHVEEAIEESVRSKGEECSECGRIYFVKKTALKTWRRRSPGHGVKAVYDRVCTSCFRADEVRLGIVEKLWTRIKEHCLERGMITCADCDREIYDPVTGKNLLSAEWDHDSVLNKGESICAMVQRGDFWEDISAELQKCTLVCVWCHSLRTAIEIDCGIIGMKRGITSIQKEIQELLKPPQSGQTDDPADRQAAAKRLERDVRFFEDCIREAERAIEEKELSKEYMAYCDNDSEAEYYILSE